MSDYEMIINNIKEIISEKGMKYGVVAERAGFTPQEFSNMLNGRKLLRAEYISYIAKALGVDPNTIYYLKSAWLKKKCHLSNKSIKTTLNNSQRA